MTNEEVKAAFKSGCPVTLNGIQYQRVSALIYRKNRTGAGMIVQAELLDKNCKGVVIASPKQIEPVKDESA